MESASAELVRNCSAVSGSSRSTKLKFDNIHDLILGEDIHRKTSGEYSNSLLSAKEKGRGRKQDRGQKQNKSRSKLKKRAGDYDDALVCCVENTIDDRIMDSGASFHATYCKEELERFKLRSGKVRLTDDKTLDIIGVGDVALKTSFGTSWTLKDVRYIPGLKKRLISIEKLDEEGRKVWVYFLKNKYEVFNTFKKWKAAIENETNLRVKCLKSDNGGEYSSREFIEYCAENGIRMLKTVPKTPQQNGVAERMNPTLNETAKKDEWQGKEVSLAHLRVFGCDSYVKVKDVARDKLDAKSVKCTFIGYGSDEMGYRFWDSKSHMVVRSRDVTFNEDSLYGAKAATDSSNLTKPIQKDQVVLEDSLENLANKSIVTEHRLSSEITQSLAGDQIWVRGPKTVRASRIVEDHMKKTMKTEHPSRREDPRLHSYKDSSESPGIRVKEEQYGKKRVSNRNKGGFLVSWERRKPRIQVEEKSVRIKASTETMLSQEFKMKDLDLAKQILGMSVIRDKMKGTLRLFDV
ncbi:retrovirus-related pol polyprotein from transposon TNT 1-94 [Tanacetum coccineum]